MTNETKAQYDVVRSNIVANGQSFDCCDRCSYRAVDDAALAALDSLHAKVEQYRLLLDALLNQSGHLNHPSGECTGECAEIREAMSLEVVS